MDVVAHAVLSLWGVTTLGFAIAAIVAFAFLRGPSRIIASSTAAGVALFMGAVGLVVSAPEAKRAEIRKLAVAELVVAHNDIANGFNLNAAAALNNAKQLFNEINARDGLALVNLARGDLERIQGRLAEARTRYAAAAIQLDLSLNIHTPKALLRLGHIEAALGNTETARSMIEQAISLFRHSGLDAGEAEALLAGGVLASRVGALAEATALLKSAATLFEELGQPLGQARALLELSDIRRTLLRMVEATRLAAEADSLFEQANVPFGLVLTTIVMGWGASDHEFPELGVSRFQRALNELSSFSDPLAEAGKFLGLSEVGTLDIRPGDERVDFIPDESLPEAVAANLAAFPNHHIEARALIAEAKKEIELGIFRAGRDL